jgi:hypothetical protein
MWNFHLYVAGGALLEFHLNLIDASAIWPFGNLVAWMTKLETTDLDLVRIWHLFELEPLLAQDPFVSLFPRLHEEDTNDKNMC